MSILILSKKSYDFVDDNGKNVKGTNIFYMMKDVSDIIKLSINEFNNNMHLADKITAFPGLYDVSFRQEIKKNNIVSVISDLKFVEKVNLF